MNKIQTNIVGALTDYANGNLNIRYGKNPKTRVSVDEWGKLKRVWNNGAGSIAFAQVDKDGVLVINKLFCSRKELAAIKEGLNIPYEFVSFGYPDYYSKGLLQMRAK